MVEFYANVNNLLYEAFNTHIELAPENRERLWNFVKDNATINKHFSHVKVKSINHDKVMLSI